MPQNSLLWELEDEQQVILLTQPPVIATIQGIDKARSCICLCLPNGNQKLIFTEFPEDIALVLTFKELNAILQIMPLPYLTDFVLAG